MRAVGTNTLEVYDGSRRHGTARPETPARAASPARTLQQRIDGFFERYPDGHITQGKAPASGDVQLATNDYLALARDPRLAHGAPQAEAADVYMSGVYVQYLGTQRAFERDMARFLGAEDAVLCQSGFAANEGLVQSVADSGMPVYLDHFAHASLFQGVVAARAPLYVFRHNDPDHLRSLILKHGAGLVGVDAIYSTTGDECDLASMIDLCEETGCLLVVDESHSVGVMGERGEGMVESLGLSDRVAFRTLSLSKAFVGRGGIVAGSRRFVEYFRYESRPAIFSSAVLPWEIARFSRTLEFVETEPWRRTRLAAASAFLRNRLTALGYAIGDSTTAIVPLIAGPESNTLRLRDVLEANGVFGAVFCAPATPRNRSLVRLCVNAGLTDEELERVVDVLSRIRNEIDLASWPSMSPRKARQARHVPNHLHGVAHDRRRPAVKAVGL